jgi:hypothetical protein
MPLIEELLAARGNFSAPRRQRFGWWSEHWRPRADRFCSGAFGYSRGVPGVLSSPPIAPALGRSAHASGRDAAAVGAQLAEQLAGCDASLILSFVDHRLSLGPIGGAIERATGAPCIASATTGLICGADPALREGGPETVPGALAIALSRQWSRFGVGIAKDLAHHAAGSGRGATHQAAAALGLPPAMLEADRHVAISLFDGRGGNEEAFCVGSAGAAPQVKFVGGIGWAEAGRPNLSVGGSEMVGAGAVLMLESARPFRTLSSIHVEPSDIRCVVTASHGRRILELDGYPAVSRYRKLLACLGAPELPFDALVPRYPLAMYMRGTPYIRSIRSAQGEVLELTSAISSGQILRVMRAGDLIGSTVADLAVAADALSGIDLLLAFSCVSRRRDATTRGMTAELAAAYARYPVAGFDSHGEQAGMVLVNHTLSGLAIGGGG